MSENTITELFQRDPLELQRQDFEAIIEHYRKNRLNFNLAAKKTATSAAAKKVEKANSIAEKVGINLDELDI